MNKKYFKMFGMYFFAAIALASFVLAAGRTGISPLDSAFEMIGRLFNIQALRSPYVQEGFLKFMLFIVLFAISNFGLNKIFNNGGNNPQGKKVAGIISFAFSMIGIFMMPTAWLNVTGGIVAAIMSSFIFIFIFYGGMYVAMAILRDKEGSKSPGWLMNLFGILLLLLLIALLELWQQFAQVPIF
jgi:hypothetical protein